MRSSLYLFWLLILPTLWTTNNLAQSDVAFPASVYAGRRARLARQLGDAVVVLPGKDLIRRGGTKQDPNFWYLTGVESPYALTGHARARGQERGRPLLA